MLDDSLCGKARWSEEEEEVCFQGYPLGILIHNIIAKIRFCKENFLNKKKRFFFIFLLVMPKYIRRLRTKKKKKEEKERKKKKKSR